MAGIESIVVNEKTYKVQKLGVLDTLYLQAEILRCLGSSIGDIANVIKNAGGKIGSVDMSELGSALSKVNPEDLKTLEPKILSQVITPENKFLGDVVYLEEWFSRPDNAGDVWGVLIRAASVLLGEYLPRFLKGSLPE